MISKEIKILLRHDIDYLSSVDHIKRVISIERENGVRSTIFIRSDAVKDLDYLLSLQDKGWEFGIHLFSRVKSIAEAQIIYLKSLGFKITGLSTCGSIHLGDKEWYWSNLKKSFENWKMIDSLGMNYICNFGLFPANIDTPVVETGPFSLDNLFVARYKRSAYKKLLQSLDTYKTCYDFPYYPILVHPDNLFYSTASYGLVEKWFPRLFRRYFMKGMNRLGYANSLKPFTKLVEEFKDSIIPYRDAVPLIGSSGIGFDLYEYDNLNSPINLENHRGAVVRSKIQ